MFYVGKKYIMDGNQVVVCREYYEAEYAYFEVEDGTLGFEVVFCDDFKWRHQSSGDEFNSVELKGEVGWTQ